MGRMANMKVPEMSKVQMPETTQRSRQAKDKTDSEADKIEGFHGYWLRRFTGLPAPAGLWVVRVEALVGAAALSGRSTCSNRSAREGVSSTASSSRRQRRESLFCASVNSAWHNSGSRRNRSAPLTSHRSSLS